MFTDPELARIGLNETEAKTQGVGLSATQNPNGCGVAHSHTFGDTRLHEDLIGKKVVILQVRPPTYELGLRESGNQRVNVGGDFLDRTDLWHCPDLLRTEE
jgi:hypothetical protein